MLSRISHARAFGALAAALVALDCSERHHLPITDAGSAFDLASEAVASLLGPGSVDITPTSPTSVGSCIPFGNNILTGFSGFIYRNVPSFTLAPGSKIAFDLGALNDVAVQRNIYLATANRNPDPGGIPNVEPQGIFAASGWTQIVSDAQTPENPRGNAVMGDYELRYTVEAPFTFAGGGLIVGFGGSPPGTYRDSGCDQVGIITTSNDASGHFYARFFQKPDRTTGVLDVGTGGTGLALGGIVILPVQNRSPVASAGPDQAVECTGFDGAAVMLDGSGSSDPDDDALAYTWKDAGGNVIAGGVNPAVVLSLGAQTLTLVVSDGRLESTDEVVIAVRDTHAPTITMRVDPEELWPPNQKMTLVARGVMARDVCDPSPALTVSLSSNEPVNGPGDGNTEPDWLVVSNSDGTFDVWVRAERAGPGNGRIYTITAVAADHSGNVGTASGTVTVPLDQGKSKDVK